MGFLKLKDLPYPDKVDQVSLRMNLRTAWENFKQIFADYQEGTCTLTLTGVTTTVTGTAQWVRIGKMVSIHFPTLQGTSSSTSCTITGLPSALIPARTQGCAISEIADNSNSYSGFLAVQTNGVIGINFRSSLTVGPGAVFTAAGTKGIGGCTIHYNLL